MSKTVEKALRILCYFEGDGQEYSLSDVASALKQDKATVSRLLKTLEQANFLMISPRTRKYRLGPRILELAGRFNFQRDVRSAALPEMVLLRNQALETVGLSFPLDTGRVCVEQVESQLHVRAVMPLGIMLPYHAGSVGRAMLAHMPRFQLERILDSAVLTRFSEHTITDRDHLLENLRQVRLQGYALSMGERLVGSCGISVPIFNPAGQILAALTVIGPSQRMSREVAMEILPLMHASVHRITAGLFGERTASTSTS